MTPHVTVLGPCPGCDAWQVDIADDVTVGPTLLGRGLGLPLVAISREAGRVARVQLDMIEEAVREHALECVLFEATLHANGMSKLLPADEG